MASTVISPQAVAIELRTLNEEETKELFYFLNVQLNVLDGVDSNHRGNMRKIYYIQAWFDQESQASWKLLVNGLRLIQKDVLADTLASKHGLGDMPISASIPALHSSLAAGAEASDPGASGPPPLASAAGPVVHDSYSSHPSRKVLQVRAEIGRLIDTFTKIMSATRDEMSRKESIDPSFLDEFRDCLLDLPVAKKAPHVKFFHQAEDDFINAKNVRKIFFILKRHCNYFNYEVLQQIISKFCKALLQRRMQKYCQSLRKFEMETTVNIYLKAITAKEILSSEFVKMAVKINKETAKCTLHDVRKFKEVIAEKASLEHYSVYIGDISESSVELELGIHVSCVGWALGAMTPNFLATHLLSEILIDDKQLPILDKSQEKLVCIIAKIMKALNDKPNDMLMAA